jgi:hypothetical protein
LLPSLCLFATLAISPSAIFAGEDWHAGLSVEDAISAIQSESADDFQSLDSLPDGLRWMSKIDVTDEHVRNLITHRISGLAFYGTYLEAFSRLSSEEQRAIAGADYAEGRQ